MDWVGVEPTTTSAMQDCRYSKKQVLSEDVKAQFRLLFFATNICRCYYLFKKGLIAMVALLCFQINMPNFYC
jgi:hypothetical protein